MGKARSLRARVHQVAVRPTGEAAPGLASPAREVAPLQSSTGGVAGKELACMNADVFAGTTIEPSALVQKLDVETRSVASVRRGAEAKTILPKKEKLKLRRERWLQKIEAIKLAEQKRRAERKRRATVVVGDLQPLRDALPELLELEASGQRPPTRRSLLPCGTCCLPGQWRALCGLWPPVKTRMWAILTPFSVSLAERPAGPGPQS
ncbi:ribosome biogenesis protein SLX9 homolog isoform X3 [Moschus berezovskii]|uniref:ribosome biogenesis protein SLX9 homolog isoform X3 n=1 Tax=Moschus berezovskii TaxID=68408 RepID=UPI00244477C0|nr:ribosome biogenesis protein SLX9 homolog isoform X3 [Moschus berezovskii]